MAVMQRIWRAIYNLSRPKDWFRFGLRKFYFNYKPFRPLPKRKDKPFLIYMVACGSLNAAYAGMLCDTLRHEGQYRDDILVFSDSETKFDPAFKEAIKVIEFKGHPAGWRMSVGGFIDVDKYSQILYLDTDILCVKPIEPLFCAWDCVRFLIERVLSKHTALKMHALCCTPDEVKKFGIDAVNSGHWCVPASMLRPFLDKWNEIYLPVAERHWAIDQSALNVLIRRNLLPNYPWDNKYVQLMSIDRPSEETILVHFIANQKRYIEDTYKYLISQRS